MTLKSMPHCPRCLARLVPKRSLLMNYLVCPNYPKCQTHADVRKPAGRVHAYAHRDLNVAV